MKKVYVVHRDDNIFYVTKSQRKAIQVQKNRERDRGLDGAMDTRVLITPMEVK